MNDLELLADQAAAAVFFQGADQFRAAYRELDAFVSPGLADQAQGGDDLASAGVFHHGEVACLGSRVFTIAQVARPQGNMFYKIFPGVHVHDAVELGYRFHIVRGCAAQHQAVFQFLGDVLLVHRDSL